MSAALLWLWLGLAAALGAPVELTVSEGPLRPARPATLEVAVLGEAGPPALRLAGGTARGPDLLRPGVWAWRIVPDAEASSLELVVEDAGGRLERSLPVEVPSRGALRLPPRIDGTVRGGDLSFVVESDAPVPADALEVVLGEGSVRAVEPCDEGLEVTVRLEDTPFPRAIPVGVRDGRFEEQPTWSRIRLRARPRIPLQAEPGATLVLTLAGRSYGPYTADEHGQIEAWIDQFPGELAAHALFRDDLGNETHTEVPLVAQGVPALVAFPTGSFVPGRPPPLVWLHALAGDGDRWRGADPTCRTPTVDLPLRRVGESTWLLVPDASGELSDVRVECQLDGVAATSFRVEVAEGVPSSLQLRVWPTELRTDFPVAEVRAVIEDIRGERLPVDGVELVAARGEIVRDEADGGIVARAEYRGEAAASLGADTLEARWDPAAVDGLPEALELRWGDVPGPEGGAVDLHVRPRDAVGRPVRGVSIQLAASAAEGEATSGQDGWASASLVLPPGEEPVLLQASAAGREARTLVHRGEPGRGGPGVPDLHDVRAITISPGRVTGISVQVEPPVLRAAPGAVAWVYVQLEDRSGSVITDEQVRLEVSEGEVGALHARGDGTLVAEYVPDAVDQAREVVITAHAESLRSSTRLALEPRVVRLSAGPWVGWQSNLGEVGGPVFGVDVDLRLRARLVGEAVMLRFGVAGYGLSSLAPTGFGADAQLRASVLPVTAGVLLREDRGPLGLWGGGGGALAVARSEVRFGDDLVGQGSSLHVGPVLFAGLSYRMLGGEAVLLLRSTWLGGGGGELGWTGNIGGLAGGAGFRVVY